MKPASWPPRSSTCFAMPVSSAMSPPMCGCTYRLAIWRAEQQAPRIARHAEPHQPDFAGGIDDDHVAAAPADGHEAAEQAGMVRGGIAADEDVEIAALHVLELHGRGAGPKAGREADAARLVAVERAVVDVVRAERPGEELQQETGFVRGPAAGVEEAAAGRGCLQLRADACERLVPADDRGSASRRDRRRSA